MKIKSTDGRGHSNQVTFSVERDDSSVPNRASIRVANLSRATLDRLAASKEFIPCRIQAGYVDNYQLIFFGELRRGFIQRDRTDIIFDASAGENTEQIKTAKINCTFPAKTEVKTIVTTLAKTLGAGSVQDTTGGILNQAGVLTKALAVKGDSGYELSRILDPYQIRWYVTGDTIVLQQFDQIVADSKIKIETFIKPPEVAWVKNPKTNVLERIVRVQCIMEPSLAPGHRFEVAGIGAVVARSTTFRGDTHGSTWELDIEGKLLE